MFDELTQPINALVYRPESGMVHPGLPAEWVLLLLLAFTVLMVRSVRVLRGSSGPAASINMVQLPILGGLVRRAVRSPYMLVSLRVLSAGVFLLVIYAGLFGTPIPERNIATVLTWTLWWSGVVISVFFVGSAWCAICPWDTLASWLVNHRLWRRGNDRGRLNLRVPKIVRNVWPALFMFVGLTWLELGAGVTTSPYATALLALLMVVLAVASLAIYERKAFCRYFCAVGRTLGAYGGISPVALRPVKADVCAQCKTLECYHGTTSIEPCPTHLVMGSIKQNTYCTSCGACSQSCPHENVGWKIRRVGDEIVYASRPHWDEAWFILGLMSLTLFHGFTMMPYWEGWMSQVAYWLGDSGRLLASFSLGMLVAMLLPVLLYIACVFWAQHAGRVNEEFRRLFSVMAFSALPLAFAYHLAHNLTHLVREGHGFWNVLANPLGGGALPLSMQELHMRHMNPLLPDNVVFALQATLILFGFWLALRIVRLRVLTLDIESDSRRALTLIPMLVFVAVISLTNLWLLMQPMVMRM